MFIFTQFHSALFFLHHHHLVFFLQKIAPVRWIKGGCHKKMNTIEEFAPPRKILEPTTNTISGLFSFSFLPGKVDQRKIAFFSPGLMAHDCETDWSNRDDTIIKYYPHD